MLFKKRQWCYNFKNNNGEIQYFKLSTKMEVNKKWVTPTNRLTVSYEI